MTPLLDAVAERIGQSRRVDLVDTTIDAVLSSGHTLTKIEHGRYHLACEIDWNDRKAVRDFAEESNTWLRLGPGYRVETEAV